MARRVSVQQLKSQVRQAQQKQQRAVDDYNRAVRKFNTDERQRVASVNRAIDNLNRAARAYNARVSESRRRLREELSRLSRVTNSPSSALYSYRVSAESVHGAYSRFEDHAGSWADPVYDRLLELSGNETRNSLDVGNEIADGEQQGRSSPAFAENPSTRAYLARLSDDLERRWSGAIYALSPDNPDAARHFCTSAREVFTQILDIHAPDNAVLASDANCEVTKHGTPSRRAKIRYILAQRRLVEPTLEEFVDADLENIVQLFRVFNDGTHGSAGKFSMAQLLSIRKRVEDGVAFLGALVAPS